MSTRGIGPSPRLVPIAFGAVAFVLTVGWVGAAIAMSGRGLDITDEGFYLLSYRWWNSTPRAFTGVQYVYGPVFELLGFSVRGLRLFRLVTVVAAHAAFAWAFVSWWAVRRPQAFPAISWRWASGLAIVASGGITYGWLPMSPAYNDVAALASLALLATLLRALRGAQLHGRLPVLPAVAVGPLAVVLVMAKWAAAGVTLGFLGLATVVAIGSMKPDGRLRFVGVMAASSAVSLGLTDLLVGGYASVVPPLVEVNRLVAASSNSPAVLLRMYATSGLRLLGWAAAIVLPAVALLVSADLLRRRGQRSAARFAVVLAPVTALLVVAPGRLGLPGGGSHRVKTYTACLVAMAMLVLVGALITRRLRDRVPGLAPARPVTVDAVIYVVLLALPVIQALGTGNPVYFVAVDQLAAWVALFVVVSSSTQGMAQWLVVAATSCAVVVSAQVGFSGLIEHPYRTAAYSDATTPIGGSGPLAPLRVSQAEAERFAAVRGSVGAVRPGQPMMAFDELPGLILALDGRSVGEAWYSALDRPRAAAGIREACRNGDPWVGQEPIIFFDRALDQAVEGAIASCGLDLTTDFRKVRIPGFDPALIVYLPLDRRNPS